MGKIICEICGTVYPDTAECCPICGYSRDLGGFSDSPSYSDADYNGDLGLGSDEYDLGTTGGEDLYGSQNSAPDPYSQNPYGNAPYQAPQQPSQGRRQIFDYDAVNPREKQPQGGYDSYQDVGNDVTLNDYPQDRYDNYDNYYQEKPKSHVGLIIFLIILILLLMAASGFLLIKFILPNLNPTEPYVPETTVMITEAPTTEPTTLPTFPCETLSLVEGGEVKLTKEGQYYLIHATVSPENTTDKLIYASEDETVIIVDEGGKITAVGEGTTNVVLTCGTQILKLPVTVAFGEETTEATGETTEGEEAAEAAETEEGAEPEETFDTVEEETDEEAAPEEEKTEGTEETEEPTEPDVELKLKKSDLASGVQGVSFRLELDCPLDPKDIEWTSTDLRVATVKDGVVTTVGPGTCQIVAKYGSQEVRCVIRCNF